MNVTRFCAFLVTLLLLVSLVAPLPASALSAIQVMPNRTIARIGDELTWTVLPKGISGVVAYLFALYRDADFIGTYDTGSTPSFKYVPDAPGTYNVFVFATDESNTLSAASEDVIVAERLWNFESVTCDHLSVTKGIPIKWTVNVTGETEGLLYSYQILCSGYAIDSFGETTANSITYTPTDLPYPELGIRAFVTDGVNTEMFSGPGLYVVGEDAPYIVSITPNATIVNVGEMITWSLAAEPGVSGDTGLLGYRVELNGDTVSNCDTEDLTYSYTPTIPGECRLYVTLYSSGTFEIRGSSVQVEEEGIAVEATWIPGLKNTPAPTPILVDPGTKFDLGGLQIPKVFPGSSTTPAPNSTPTKLNIPKARPTSTPTPSPTLNPDLPIFEKPTLHFP